MKIDNKWFCLTWEKKRPGGVWLSLLLCAALLAGSFGGGMWLGSRNGNEPGQSAQADVQSAADENGSQAGGGEGNESLVSEDQEDAYVEGTYVTSAYLAGSVMEKYGETISPYGYTYGPAITGLKRDENILLQIGFSVEEAEFEYWTEIADLFQDPQLTNSLGNRWEYDEDVRTLAMLPSNYPVGEIGLSELDTVTAGRYEHDDNVLFPHDSGSAWGNLGTMYLAIYVDLETGENLERPQVQVVTLEGELQDTPRLTYSFTEDGRVHFSWTRVEGAEEYFICRIGNKEGKGLDGFLWVMDTVVATEWTSPAPMYGSATANQGFRNYSVAEDDWYGEYTAEKVIGEYGETPLSVYNVESRNAFCVIAVSKEGTSMMSNYVDTLDIQGNIPVKVAYNTWCANGFAYGHCETIEEVLPYGYVTMADGTTAMKLIDYDTEKAVVIEDRYIYYDDDGNYLEGQNVKELNIPYRIEGTPFEDVMSVAFYNESRMEEDLRFIEEREDLLRKRAGDVTLDNDVEFGEDEAARAEVRQVVDIKVTANSALSEYLALNMLSGVDVIDVSEFREAADTALLVDAFLEAYYQNPLILGISGYKINRRGTAVKVIYEQSAKEQAQKQEEILAKVSEIIGQIITPGMTELEKELAINQYLCDTCTYDDSALENAEKNNYQYVDDRFNDSFTAYGALLNGRCVCAGYAAAFKLLADAAGLECIVVTGALEGTLPHAWNKVRIDGDWEILDVTNNDNEFLTNALLNLPDEAGRRTLTEDSDYVMDGYLRNYASTNGQKEYYRVNRMYFPYNEIAGKLAEQLNEKGTALLRTEYSLDDETFALIGQEVIDALDTNTPIYGYYWMGVIYLTY